MRYLIAALLAFWSVSAHATSMVGCRTDESLRDKGAAPTSQILYALKIALDRLAPSDNALQGARVYLSGKLALVFPTCSESPGYVGIQDRDNWIVHKVAEWRGRFEYQTILGEDFASYRLAVLGNPVIVVYASGEPLGNNSFEWSQPELTVLTGPAGLSIYRQCLSYRKP